MTDVLFHAEYRCPQRDEKKNPNVLGMVLSLIWAILVLLFLVSKEHGSGFRRRELEGHGTEDVKQRGITEGR